ncbi:hypothetical protein M3C63_06690 [Brevibacterium luteolum]|uniref:hypothetical protein n=1 Tax=Brevibacterium luteolum TaxID=199591 RepID=UPI00223BF4E5|nr:hypothetical protein [Brevibacterium luteolum]MCT1921544.1 hypothetical protein [Brevibacterium luteolum]
MSGIKHFLLVFDHAKDKLIEQLDFGDDAERAVEEYAVREAEYRDSSSVDIVLVGSDSIETVKVTHSTYFEGFNRGSRNRILDRLLSS